MQGEYELKVRNERLMEAERNVRLGYVYWDLVCDKIEMSEMAADVLDIRVGSQGTTYAELLHQLKPKEAEVVQDFIENQLLRSTTLTSYFRITTSFNEERYILVKADVVKNSLGDPVIVKGTIQNVSELRELQKMDEQKQKLKKIAWVQSHKMRSPVASILGMANLFNYQNPSDPVNTEILNNIKELTLNLDAMIHEVDELTRDKVKDPLQH
jgi:signal transduction histidine kinase